MQQARKSKKGILLYPNFNVENKRFTEWHTKLHIIVISYL